MLVCLVLALITAVALWPMLQGDFINYDDAEYVRDNPHVSAGLNMDDIGWALTSTYAANWHPLTWISYMVDTQFAGADPRAIHRTNLLIHIASTVLLFLVLHRMTGSTWRSAFAALLFGIHPLHVESVAWISERKDVLSTFFWFATIWAYVRYVERPSRAGYALVLAGFVLGLMSKPMLVTLPLTLLLLDFWPLERMKSKEERRKKVREKVPLFAITAASCVITMHAQRLGNAFGPVSDYPLYVRLMNGIYAYAVYIRKMLWPSDLAIFYPHPGFGLLIWKAAFAGLLLIGITVAVLRSARERPYMAFGWLWYVVTLIPVIGIVQVGSQAMADRYAYVPLVGLFVMAAWGVPGLFGKGERERGGRGDSRPIMLIVASVVLVALAVMTWRQSSVWRDSETLFRHAIRVTKSNYLAHNQLGYALAEQDRTEEAIAEYRRSIEIAPKRAPAHNSLGAALAKLGKMDEAIAEYRIAVELAPDNPGMRMNLGTALATAGDLDGAVRELDTALKLDPNSAEARDNLNLVLQMQQADEAIVVYRQKVRANPGSASAHYELGTALERTGQADEAIREYHKAVQLDPALGDAHRNLAVLLFFDGQYGESWKEAHLARKHGTELHPDFIKELSGKMPDPGG